MAAVLGACGVCDATIRSGRARTCATSARGGRCIAEGVANRRRQRVGICVRAALLPSKQHNKRPGSNWIGRPTNAGEAECGVLIVVSITGCLRGTADTADMFSER